MPMNVTLGSTAVFSCIFHRNVGVVFWIVNGNDASSLINEGVAFSSPELIDGVKKSQLFIPAYQRHNNSLIQCGIVLQGNVQVSNPIELQIQG